MQVKAATLKFVSFSSSNAQSIFFPTIVMAALLIGCFIMRLRNRKPSLQEVFLERSSHSLWQALIFFPEVKGYIHSPTDIQFHIFFGGGSSRPYPIGRRLVITVVKTRGAFHSSKTSGLNFLQLPVTNRTAFPKFLKKKTISRGRPKFFTNLFLGSFLSIRLCSQNF